MLAVLPLTLVKKVFLFLLIKNWGPQPIRVLMTNIGSFGLSLATAKDANVKTMADMKGKRVSWVQGAPALNWNVAAQLSFAVNLGRRGES